MLTDIVDTKCGRIVGLKREHDNAFLGIRYATAERFSAPKTVKSWEGVYEATKFGSCCPQQRAYFDEAAFKNPFYYKEFRQGLEFSYDEDCLFLNIFAPKKAVNAPVVIYIHGGNFTKGSGDEKPFDGEEYAKRGVIFVSLNYRLNVFGFFADGQNARGNFALYDQLAAIDWIRENIAAFGGNPDAITLMGQSAGAMSVQSLICSRLAKGKIKRAIMLSGGGVRKLILKEKKPNEKFWRGVMKKSGAKSFDEFKRMHAKDVYLAWQNSSPVKSLFATAPTVDGKIISRASDTPSVPCIIGRVKKDMFPPELAAMGRRYAKVQSKNNVPCYLYEFSHPLKGDDRGTFHSADLWFAVGALKRSWRPFDKEDYDLSSEMIDRFCAFIGGDSPNSPKYKRVWKAYKDKDDEFKF